MKKLILGFSGLLITLSILSSCSKSNIAQNNEYDDMYFSSVDREKLTASSKEFYDQNFNETYQEPLSSDQVLDYSDINYSSKTINPEYIAKYASNDLQEEADTEESTEYFDKDYNKSEDSGSDASDIKPERYSSYSGSNAGGFGIYPSFAFGYSSGFGYNPYGYNPYGNSPWGYNPYRYGDPFGYYPSYGSPYYGSSLRFTFGRPFGYYNPYSSFYSPWGYSPYYGYSRAGYAFCPSPAYYGGGRGYGSGSSYYYTRNDVSSANSRIVSVRNVTRGPRSSKGKLNTQRNGSNDYRSGDGDNRFYPGSGSTVASNGRTSNSGDQRNNYYKRTRTRNTSDANTRGYQKTSRSYNDSENYSRTRTSVPSSSNYSRSSRSSYKTGNSRGSIFRNSNGISGLNTRSSGSRRSSFSTPSRSRSSGTSFRSSGSSSRSFSSGSSRSSSGSSRSSSGSSRSSSSGSKRGN